MRTLLQHGAAILMAAAAIIFVTHLGAQLFLFADVENGIAAGNYVGAEPSIATLLAAVAASLSASALPFIGACLIDRLDHWIRRTDVDSNK